MHIAIGYRWHPNNPIHRFEQTLQAMGHIVTYVGLSSPERMGYDNIALNDIITNLPQPPDLYLWIDPAGRYFPPGIEDLTIPTACYLIDVHLGQWRQQVARFFDAVFIAEHEFVESYRQVVRHEQVYWLPLCIDPAIHRNLGLPRGYEVGFVGNIARAHKNTPRAHQLQLIAKHFKTNDFYRPYSQAEISQVYNQSRIVFNTSISGGVTLRILEGTACGALVITDTRAEAMGNLFEIGQELVTFTNEHDLLDKITYYLSHEEERAKIAQAGCRRTHEKHTYKDRAQTIIETILSSSFKQLAPLRYAPDRERLAVRRQVYIHLHMLDDLFDLVRAANYSPWQRLLAIWPCLIRRLLI
jgi:hypothetical protein